MVAVLPHCLGRLTPFLAAPNQISRRCQTCSTQRAQFNQRRYNSSVSPQWPNATTCEDDDGRIRNATNDDSLNERRKDTPFEPFTTLEGLRDYRERLLRPRLLRKRAELSRLCKSIHKRNKSAIIFSDIHLALLLLLLATRTVILFYCTYFLFDWNLVEPIAYMLDRGVLWLELAWFSVIQNEISYSSCRAALASRYVRYSHQENAVDLERWRELTAEVERLEELLRGLENV
ncbi:putative Mitochondrial calcium uniporter [Trypanosoma vivax]|uniref:Calcium uniporter protein C-terminal domain-containing protein n=1 Tax=Trypanosoma vivax (strain Y486) TaxID=1055687 RepID=G0U5L0_TRYVY|nr:putative Mitochondrial calcium uniporter [Trypanosoma vivax]CCC51161.1 conserved hypothetical protein [Trypanosoma vivax Y486]